MCFSRHSTNKLVVRISRFHASKIILINRFFHCVYLENIFLFLNLRHSLDFIETHTHIPSHGISVDLNTSPNKTMLLYLADFQFWIFFLFSLVLFFYSIHCKNEKRWMKENRTKNASRSPFIIDQFDSIIIDWFKSGYAPFVRLFVFG